MKKEEKHDKKLREPRHKCQEIRFFSSVTLKVVDVGFDMVIVV